MFTLLHIVELLPDAVSFADPAIGIGSWLGMGLVEPLRAGLAVASVWPLAVVLSGCTLAVRIGAALVVIIAGAWAADAWEALLPTNDDRRIVVDEVAGYLAGMALLGRAGWLVAGGFAGLFLALDRLKPWPFDRIETLPDGVGVMLDDVAIGPALGLAVLLATVSWRRIAGGEPSP